MKEFVIENGQMYYRKKSLHQQPLFWTTLVGFVLTFILGVTCVILTLGRHDSRIEGVSYPDYVDHSMSYTEYQVGESADFYDGLRVTVTSMGKDNTVDLVDDYYSSAYVVEMNVKNTTDSDVYFDEYYFSLLDPTTELPFTLDLRTYDVNLVEKIAPGETISVRLIYGIDDETKVAFVYDDAMWTELVTEGI